MASPLEAKPIAVAGFMGVGKSTVGRELAHRLGRPFADSDAVAERRAGSSVRAFWEREGEAAFRALEESVVRELLERDDAPVIALGGGCAHVRGDAPAGARARAVRVARRAGRRSAGGAWTARRAPGRSRATMAAFEQLHDERGPLYRAAADAIVAGEESPEAVAGAIAQQVWTRPGIAETALGEGAVAIVDRALTLARAGAIELEGGEAAKSLATLERLWRALAERELERGDVIVCAGGGSITDVGGFAAATFRRGVPWLAVPSTLVGQVDAAIGGKTAINVAAKNDVGAFWQPKAVLCDPVAARDAAAARVGGRHGRGRQDRPARRRTAVGARRGLGAGHRRASPRAASSCSAASGVKTLVVAADPEDRGPRAILNLGHTIGHGIESVAGYGGLSHGECVSIGLVAALRLSEDLAGLEAGTAEHVAGLLERHGLPVRAPGLDPAAVLAAMRHDKKRTRRDAPDGAAGGDREARLRRRRRRAGARRRRTRRHRSPLD